MGVNIGCVNEPLVLLDMCEFILSPLLFARPPLTETTTPLLVSLINNPLVSFLYYCGSVSFGHTCTMVHVRINSMVFLEHVSIERKLNVFNILAVQWNASIKEKP